MNSLEGTDDRVLANSVRLARNPPVNIAPEDEHLFRAEYTRDIPAFLIDSLGAAYIDENHFIFEKFKILDISLALNRMDKMSLLGLVRFFIKSYLLKKTVHVSSRAFVVTDNWSGGFFHWMLDVIPKIASLYKMDPEFVFLISEDTYQVAYVKESMRLMGIENFYTLKKNRIYHFDRLEIISPIGYTGNFHPRMIEISRSFFHKTLNATSGSCIYVSRKKASRRRIVNEDDIIYYLGTRNFEIVCLEDHNLEEQIKIISRAKMVVSVHGAALSHLMFMHSSSRVLEIRGENDAIRNCYFSLASVLSIDYHYYLAKEADEGSDEDLLVDLSAFEVCIDTFVKGGE
ncbi:MAG: glycosyltransferase family 61 protein [Imperialibacter sp.]|uniref:glycosyltransferase family 61 protein n=1 Tax=Imperialibacter sp. TaxID=2038411 RepID=UPI0032EF0F55